MARLPLAVSAALSLAVSVFSATVFGGETLKAWDFTRPEDRQAVACRNGAVAAFDEDVGGLTIRLPEGEAGYAPVVAFGADATLKAGETCAVHFEARATAPVEGRVTLSDFAAPYTHRSASATFTAAKGWKSHDLALAVSAGHAGKLNLPVLVLQGPGGAAVEVRGLAVKRGAPEPRPVVIRSGERWKPVPESPLFVRKGSALDFSHLTPRDPAGTHGRVIVDDAGRLVFEKRPGAELRFFTFCITGSMAGALRDWEKEELAEYAAAIARQGYNMVRFHFIDMMLMGSVQGLYLKEVGEYRLPETPEEIRFLPDVLDHFHYFVAELRKNGIYLNLDLMSNFVGYDNGRLAENSVFGTFNTKTQLYVNENFRRNWRAGVTRLLTDPNPHTGFALKDDPALAVVCCLNEQDILIPTRDYNEVFREPWRAFYRARHPELPPGAEVPPLGADIGRNTPAGRAMAAFAAERQVEMSRWYLETLRDIGFTGPVSNWNMRTFLLSLPARAEFPVAIQNYYHAHPIFGKQTRVDQTSALRLGGNAVKNVAAQRLLDRPYFNTEFGLAFWNRFRHEQGLLLGAGAALQGWNAVASYERCVVPEMETLRYFRVGADPVARASEALTAFAFLRGDVEAARSTIEFAVDDAFIFDEGRGMRAVGDALSRLWAVARIGLGYGEPRVRVDATLRIRPGRTASVGGDAAFTVADSDNATDDAVEVVRLLRAKGALPPDNPTDPSRGLYASDTGQVRLDSAAGELFVVTPRLAGAALKRGRRVDLGDLTIVDCDVPAAVAVASLENGRPLAAARRLLVVHATDALNSGMTFADPERTTLVEPGMLPVLLEVGTVSLSLRREAEAEGEFRLYALSLAGERLSEIPVVRADGRLSFTIDTGRLPRGPTPFFELVRE